MNQLYIAMDPSLYTHFSANKVYPYADYPFPNNVDEVPSIATCNNDKEHTAAIITHAILLTTLIDTLLSLTPTVFKLLYEQKRMTNPNSVFFCQCFDLFVITYGHTLAKDHATNQLAMAANWHPLMGFEVLTSHLFHGITCTSLSGHPIMDKDAVNIGKFLS